MYGFVTLLLCVAFLVSRFQPGRALAFLAVSAGLQLPALFLYFAMAGTPFNWGGIPLFISLEQGLAIHLPTLLLGLVLLLLGYRLRESE